MGIQRDEAGRKEWVGGQDEQAVWISLDGMISSRL